MTAPAVAGVVERIVDSLRAFDLDALAGLYHADAVLDASVPCWRYQLQGRGAIAEQLREEAAVTAGTGRVTELRATPTAEGVLVEVEVHFDAEGEERLWREAHVFRTDGAGIAEHATYCTGVWDGPTIARHAVEAPMVRR